MDDTTERSVLFAEHSGDLLGATVNLSARLAGHVCVGQSLVTAPIAASVNPDDRFAALSGTA